MGEKYLKYSILVVIGIGLIIAGVLSLALAILQVGYNPYPTCAVPPCVYQNPVPFNPVPYYFFTTILWILGGASLFLAWIMEKK